MAGFANMAAAISPTEIGLFIARLHMTLNGSRASFFRIGAALHHMLIYINIVPEYGG